MEVDLFTNAPVSSVGDVSGPPETFDPANARPSVAEAPESPGITDEAQEAAPYNTSVEAAKKPVQDEPTKDFRETLEERIQAEVSQTPENAAQTEAPVEATATLNQVSAEQPQPLSAETSTDLSVALKETVAETTNMPQQEGAAENSNDLAQLLTGSGLSKAVDLTVAKPDQAGLTPTVPEATGKLTELTVEQSQIEPKVAQPAQPAQSNAASVLDAQSAAGEQNDQKIAPNDALTLQKGTAVEAKTAELVSESTPDPGRTDPSSEKSAGPIEQVVPKTQPAPQNNPDVAQEGSPDAQPGQPEQGPKISENPFIEPDGKPSANGQTEIPSRAPDANNTEAGPGEKTLPGENIIQKLDSVQAESAPSQTKGHNTAVADSNNAPDFAQAIPVDSHQISNPQQPLAAAQAPKAPANTSDADIPPTVGEQIRDSITSSAAGTDRDITIRLNPPELGSVVVKFRERADGITGLLEVSKSQTRAEIQLALPELTRDLQELGVHVKRLEVVMTSEQHNQAPNGQPATPQQDGWGGQRDATSSDPNAPNASAGDFLGDGSAYTGFIGGSQVYVTDKSIDMFA